MSEVESTEKLYRAITQSLWIINGMVLEAAFYDTKGVSVSRDGGRDIIAIRTHLEKKLRGKCINGCVVSAQVCIDNDACLKTIGNTYDHFHAEIHGSNDVILLNDEQRANISLACRICW